MELPRCPFVLALRVAWEREARVPQRGVSCRYGTLARWSGVGARLLRPEVAGTLDATGPAGAFGILQGDAVRSSERGGPLPYLPLNAAMTPTELPYLPAREADR